MTEFYFYFWVNCPFKGADLIFIDDSHLPLDSSLLMLVRPGTDKSYKTDQ